MSNKEVLGLNKITKTRLKELCKKHKLYQTPHLNDQLYLHYQGFQAIENLDEYTGLKCLWLESNAISEIQGLDCQRELKCLFLQNNLIKKIENLQACLVLDTLNLASNHITRIENCGVDVLPVLSTLNLSRNYLRNSEGLRELVNCSNLWSLDLSHNRIDDILVVKIFANMPELRVLVLQGNPVVSQVPQYRKTLILECKNLTYLDSRPVFPKDRACAEAWKRGGYEEERRENERWVREDRKKIRDSVNATLRLRQKQGGGDVQLLESTDDEEEDSKPKKLRKIPGKIVNADLEITGVDQNEDSKPDAELKTSESSSSESSDSEGSVLKTTDGFDESVVDCGHTAIEDKSGNIQSQDLDEQVKGPNEEKDLVISGESPNMSKVAELHDEEARLKIEPTAFEEATQLIFDNEDCLTKPSPPNLVAMVSNESSTLVTTLTSDSSLTSNASSNDADIVDIFDNVDKSSEYMLNEERSKDSNLKEEYKEEEDLEEDKNRVTDVVLTEKFPFNISSESQFGDSELSLPSITEEEEDLQTFEIDTQHSSRTLETDRNLSEFETSNGENMQAVSEVEDSGCFNILNSVDDSEKMSFEGLPSLEYVQSKQPQNEEQDDSAWQDMILTDLMKNEANKANEDKNKTTDSSPQSSKANTLSSSLFVENSDEELTPRETFDELDASSWLELSLETSNQEPFMEKIEEEVSSGRTEDSASTEAVGEKSSSEKSYQSDGSSLLEYILKISTEAEYDKSSTEICLEEIEDGKPFAGNDKDEILHEEPKSPSEELNYWLDKDEDRAFHKKVSLQDLLATFEKEEREMLPLEDDDEAEDWVVKQVYKVEGDDEDEDWVGKQVYKVEDDDEIEDWVGKQEYIYKQSIEDDEESLSSMYNTELGLNEDKTFEEDDLLQCILNKIEEEETLETVNEDSENIEAWLGEGKDKSFGSGLQNSFSCSSPYEEVFDNKHFSRLEGCNIPKKVANLTQEKLLKDSSETSVSTRSPPRNRTVTLSELDSGPVMIGDNMSSSDSWWERTLAAARGTTEPPNDESVEETTNRTQTPEEDVEASALLEQILTKTNEKEVVIHPNHTEAADLPSNDANDESKPPPTIREVLSSFNKVAENLTTTRYLTTYARTRDFSTQSSDQINRQVEEMNREQRARVSQMIDQVYAQKDNYDDNLEVVDGRLMVVKRSTGASEELPLPPTSSSKYTSCGVSTTQANCNDSDSDDDYGTALSEDEPDDDDDDDGDIEQHASDTKIRKIPYLSAVYGNESSTSSDGMELDEVEDNCHGESNEQTIDFNHKVMGLCNESDAVVCTEGMEKGAVSPDGWVTTDKGNGGERASFSVVEQPI